MLEEDNRMDLLQLFKLQKELDDRIAKEHDLQPKKLLKRKNVRLFLLKLENLQMKHVVLNIGATNQHQNVK